MNWYLFPELEYLLKLALFMYGTKSTTISRSKDARNIPKEKKSHKLLP